MTSPNLAQIRILRPEMLDDLIVTFDTASNIRHPTVRVELPAHQWRAVAALLEQHRKQTSENGERRQFEEWYATNCFEPVGSRECGLQWAAWKARATLTVPDGPAFRIIKEPL